MEIECWLIPIHILFTDTSFLFYKHGSHHSPPPPPPTLKSAEGGGGKFWLPHPEGGAPEN